MANQNRSPSLLTRAIEVFAAYKVSKGMFKYVLAPAALTGAAYLVYRKVTASTASV